MSDFEGFGKIARLSRMMTITEKIDGTNAQIFIGEDGEFCVGSRTRWITPDDDNFGFAAWAYAHKDELMQLGPGRHFGEWWGAGIQRKYGQTEKHWSLFNVGKWLDGFDSEATLCPACCRVVPIIYRGEFSTMKITEVLESLRHSGSRAASGFMQPEGIIVYHEAARTMFKKTFEKDEGGKGEAA